MCVTPCDTLQYVYKCFFFHLNRIFIIQDIVMLMVFFLTVTGNVFYYLDINAVEKV